jgi:glutathione peroxidase-family protein
VLKKKNNISYKGVDLHCVNIINLYGSLISIIYRSFFKNLILPERGCGSDVVVFYSHILSGRLDYEDIVTTLYKYLKGLPVSLVYLHKDKIIFNKVAIFFRIYKYYKVLGSGVARLERLKLSVLYARTTMMIDNFDKFFVDKDIKLIITFCDATDVDNILTQLSMKYGIKTATLQHGQYHILNVDVPENQALMNLQSDYLFAWGEATKNEYEHCNRSGRTSIIPLGICSVDYEESIKYDGLKIDGGFIVSLNADNFKFQNLKMIDTISKFCKYNGFFFSIKFHPSNNRAYYSYATDSVSYRQESGCNPIYVVYTSGVLVKYLASANLLLIFKDDITPGIFRDNLIGFSSVSELSVLFEKIRNDGDWYLDSLTEAQNFFIASGSSRLNYRGFIEEVLKK